MQRAGIAAGAVALVVVASGVAASLAVSIGTGSPRASGAATPTGCTGQATVTATAGGTASAPPDTLTVTLGVQTTAPTATAALSTNDTKAAALIRVLRAAGVTGPDLQTSGLSINPNYNQKNALTGYNVDDTLTAALPASSNAGKVIDSAASAVGQGISFQGLSFSLTNDSAPQLAARSQAVTTATARARAMAVAAGGTLGPLCSVSDNSNPQVQPFSSAGASAAPSGAPATPVENGSQQVTAEVTVVYAVTP